jgi:hypothetical protein
MAFSPRELRAINYYCESSGAKVQLSARPKVYFRMPDGSEKTREITHIVSDYDTYRKELSKEQARQRKADSRKAGLKR